jgi:hypothetical protein
VVVGRLAAASGLLVVCALAGCAGQSLTAERDAGAPRTVSPPPNTTAADAGALSVPVDAAAPPGPVDAATPLGTAAKPPSVDAAPPAGSQDAGPVIRLAPTSLLTGADLSAADVLAADGDGIYWVTGDNQLWMLPTGSEPPRQLAVDPNPPFEPTDWGCLLVRENDIFWTALIGAPPGGALVEYPFHRTRKTGGDVVLLPDCVCSPPGLTADGGYLYYDSLGGLPGGEIVALPLDADPGTTPTPLAPLAFDADVSSMAVDDQFLYWTAFPNDSTVQVGVGPIIRGDKASLLAGSGIASPFVDDWAAGLQPANGELYFDSAPLGRRSSVGRVDQNGSRVNLPLPGGDPPLVLDHWVASAVTASGLAEGEILAASTDAVAGDGSVPVQVAVDVAVRPVIGTPGLVFVDTTGHLLAVSARDLGTAVAAGQP